MNERRSTILAVDDTPDNLDLIAEFLGDDYTVKAAISGEVALRILERETPDLILLDIMMPGMDGYEVLRRIKQSPRHQEIPVLFLTAWHDVHHEIKGLELGAVDYVTKPVNFALLKRRVMTHLDLARAKQHLSDQNRALVEAARLRDDIERITRHDLKGPLSGVITLPQVLRLEPNLTEDQRKKLRMIERAGSRMLDMINRSLDLYKMEQGVYDLRPEPVDLVSILGEVVHELGESAQLKGLVTQVRVNGEAVKPEDRKLVNGEWLLLTSMFSNLYKNSIEAAPEGDVIGIEVGGYNGVVTVVLDNGGEVPEAIRDTFFRKYVSSGKPGGTGLGTYSAYLVATIHDGEITLDTSVAGRTKVIVSLPACQLTCSEVLGASSGWLS